MIDPKVKTVKKTVKKPVSKKVSIDRTKQNPADEYPNLKDKTGFPLIGGGEGRRAPFKKGGVIKKAKNGKSFPDLNKDGKVTKADVLKGRGVIAKKGATIKKAQMGRLIKKGVKEVAKKTVTKKPLPKINNATWEAAMSEVGREDLKAKMKLWDKDLSKKKNGGSMKKCRYGCK